MKELMKFLKWISIIFAIIFIIVLTNQFISLYKNLSQINIIFGIVVTLSLLAFLLYMLFKPIYAFLKFNRLPKMPDNSDNKEVYGEYISKLLLSLKENKALKSIDYDFIGSNDTEKVENAFLKLKKISKTIITRNSNVIFISTAISQNGVFDTISVFFTLLRMVYEIVHVYENRPSFSRILHLYVQIASASLIAGTIEDMDIIDEQLEPILTSLLGGSFISAVPGGVGVSTFVINSIVQGSVNALLSLRVGVISQRYLSATVKVDKKDLRKGAAMEAAKSLESVIRENASYIFKEVVSVTKRATIDKFKWPWK